MKLYIKSSRRGWPYNYKYEVHWISPDGRDCLLGGSNSIDEANRIAADQAYEIATSPFETNGRKYHFLDTMYIVDVDNEDEDSMNARCGEYIENLMNQISTWIHVDGKDAETRISEKLISSYDEYDEGF